MKGFVTATIDSIVPVLVRIMGKEYAGKLIDNFAPNGLISFGSTASPGKDLVAKDKYINSFMKCVNNVRLAGNLQLMIDSGGFQVVVGRIPIRELDKFIEYYGTFLNDHYDQYEEAFILDLPTSFPGGVKELYEMNLKSYKRMIELVGYEKLMFIAHFRDIMYFDAWKKMIYEDGIMDKFKLFSLAGLVLSTAISKVTPISLYAIGMSLILCRMVEMKATGTYRMHILGNASPKQVLIFYLMKELIDKVYNIQLEMSYDSAAAAKKVMLGRFIEMFNEDHTVSKIELKYEDLDAKNVKHIHKTNRELLLSEVGDMADIIGFDKSKINEHVYTSCTSPFDDTIRPFIMLLDNYQQMKIDTYCQNVSKELVSNFLKTGDITKELFDVIYALNSFKSRNVCELMSYRYQKSLEFLSQNLNIEYVEGFMRTYIAITDTVVNQTKNPCWDL